MIDALMLLGENRFGASLSPTTAIALAGELGIDRIVAAPARPLDYHLGPANSALAESAAASGGRIVRLGRVDPLDGERAVAEARRCLDELDCAGLFLHPGDEAFPVRAAGLLMRVAAEAGVPVVIATGIFARCEPLQVAELAAATPSVPVVMTSGGQINISGLSMVDAWEALVGTPNLYVMTNGEYRQDYIERLASDLDYERVLFASFAPDFDVRFEVARIRSARLTAQARQAIEQGNAARLFSITSAPGKASVEP
jgi:predicted TIM-barrel fold metal-dependent hydrolase